MINTYYGTKILDAFFHTSYNDDDRTDDISKYQIKSEQLQDRNNNIVQFPKEPYIALFTTMPNAEGSGYVEPTTPDYNRVSLIMKGPKNNQIMGKADTEEGDGVYAGKKVAVIKNQDIIVFPEIEVDNNEEGYQETIVGFGVFNSSEKSTGTLMLWGELTQPTTIKTQEIPVFRIKEFVFKLA